jgi:DNA-directed RNA polymerase subunit delta
VRRDVPGLSNLLNLEPEQIKEMAMVDLAFRFLSETKKTYTFQELYRELCQLKGLTEDEMKSLIAQIYTEINLDGRFLCLGDNQWGLKRWYLVETQEESVEGSLHRSKYLDDDDDYEDEEDLLDEEYDLDDLDEDDIDRLDDDEDEDADLFDDEIDDLDDEDLPDLEADDEDLDTV